jgi:hypothetical protein
LPDDIVQDLLRLTNRETGQLLENVIIDEHLFSSLYFFILEMLEAYYKDFKISRKFDQLQDEVQKQEILFEYLRRYSMISN